MVVKIYNNMKEITYETTFKNKTYSHPCYHLGPDIKQGESIALCIQGTGNSITPKIRPLFSEKLTEAFIKRDIPVIWYVLSGHDGHQLSYNNASNAHEISSIVKKLDNKIIIAGVSLGQYNMYNAVPKIIENGDSKKINCLAGCFGPGGLIGPATIRFLWSKLIKGNNNRNYTGNNQENGENQGFSYENDTLRYNNMKADGLKEIITTFYDLFFGDNPLKGEKLTLHDDTKIIHLIGKEDIVIPYESSLKTIKMIKNKYYKNVIKLEYDAGHNLEGHENKSINDLFEKMKLE